MDKDERSSDDGRLYRRSCPGLRALARALYFTVYITRLQEWNLSRQTFGCKWSKLQIRKRSDCRFHHVRYRRVYKLFSMTCALSVCSLCPINVRDSDLDYKFSTPDAVTRSYGIFCCHVTSRLGMVTFGSEPWFEPEPSRT
jgi:hypothetical protein